MNRASDEKKREDIDDYRSEANDSHINETIYLNSIPGMADSIINADFRDSEVYDSMKEW